MTATYQPPTRTRSTAIFIAWAASTALALPLSSMAIDNLNDTLASTFMFFIGSPALIGLLQGILLSRLLPNAWQWLPATLLGSLFSWMMFFVLFAFAELTNLSFLSWLPDIFSCVIFSGGSGIGMGIAQWLYLRKHLQRSRWWIVATAIAIGIGAGPSFCSSIPLNNSTNWPELLTIGGLLGGAIKGVALVWLLHQPKTLEAASSPNS